MTKEHKDIKHNISKRLNKLKIEELKRVETLVYNLTKSITFDTKKK